MIVYRGETKPDWPKKGISFVNYQELLV